VLKALAMVIFGLLLGMIGTDVNSGVARFSFDVPELSDGIEFVAVAMGMFGFAEIILNLEQKEKREVFTSKVTNLMPRMADLKRAFPAILRGTALGSVLGILPGGGALLSDPGRVHHGRDQTVVEAVEKQHAGQVRQIARSVLARAALPLHGRIPRCGDQA
jgi:TctA family transporter